MVSPHARWYREVEPRASTVQSIRRSVGLEGPRQPERPAQVVRPRGRAGERQPLAVRLERAVGVHDDVAVAIVGPRPGHRDLLVPAMLAAHRIGLHWEREVLM